MPEPKLLDARVIGRYLATLPLAEREDTPEHERKAAQQRIDRWEREYPGIRAKAQAIQAIMDGGPPPAGDGPSPAGTGDPVGDMFASFASAVKDSPISDPEIPWHVRLMMGLQQAQNVMDDARGFMAVPLEPQRFEISRPETNSRGELVFRVRVRVPDLRRRSFREYVADRLEQALAQNAPKRRVRR